MRLRKPLIAGIALSMMAVGPALAQQGDPTKGAEPATGAATVAGSATASDATPAASSTTTAAASAAASETAAPIATPGMDGQTYAVRLRDLEQRVDDLKEQIRRSHTRLSLLSDTVLSGGVQGSRAEVVFENDMSSAFRLTRALFVLDGAVQYNKADDTGALSEQANIPIFSGSIPPGDHTLQVLLQLQGNGYGVFSYLKGYKFEVRSTHSFKASEGKTISLQVFAYEKGGVTTPLEERPAVRYGETVTSGIAGGGSSSAPAAAPTSAAPASASTGFAIGTGGK